MADDFKLRIAITPEIPLEDEGSRINALLDSGRFTDVHLRHPGLTASGMRTIIESVEPRWRSKLHLHDFFELAQEYGLGGIHLNRRNPRVPEGYEGTVSASCHSLAEIFECRGGGLDYVTVSPVMDSLSKPGYTAAFSQEELREIAATEGITVVALGGVTPETLPLLREYGFSGYAMLTAAWK